MISKLLYFISAKIKLTDNDTELCKRYFEAVSFPKNSVIEEEEKVPKYLYYIVSGYLRLYHYNESGDEVTTHINCPPGFFTSYSNFISQQKSNEKVECITACELLRITKDDLDSLTDESPAIKDFSIMVFQQSISYNEKRSRELAALSAAQRYHKLITEQPDILHHVPIAQIASFLGMKPESLSRIRKKMIN
ncbi:CRP-like cAMP-binding protein [Flavobacterium sp. 1]|uniref:Crp/Fnr family transcriptional regulator n=1 Tax=Flavobacterium sp. 1 TaxID=2035200 RepID=UPI000C24CEE9|nr:Crp/Fnr family transcriptional regulator [Flavobacterium sp. 1]PJJ08085.1 CRP-like cAMP-binding protein [Flavobacterium sp. 1]